MPKRKVYTEEDILNGLEYIRSGASIEDASRRYKVPSSTLRWRMRNSPKKSGPEPLLHPKDEKQLADYVKFQASKGTPITTAWLRDTATRLANHRYF